MRFTHTVRLTLRGILFALTSATILLGQTVPQAGDDTVLKQIIIFGRHGVRSSAFPDAALAIYASRPYPAFSVPTGYLTPNGRQAEILMGGYFRGYLLQQGLLTSNQQDDLSHSHFRANSIQRSNISAAAIGTGLFPAVEVPVHSFPLGQVDPIFDPITAKIGAIDGDRALREVQSVYPNGDALKSAYSADFSLIRSVVLNYQNGVQPPPAPPAGIIDVTAAPVPLTLNATLATSNAINSGAIISTLGGADPFVMQYADGMPLKDVAWGQLSLDALSQQTRIITLLFNLQMTSSPYLNQVQSSNAASHVLRSMEQVVNNFSLPGGFGNSGTRLIVVNSSDAYVVGLAGLLRAHWLIPGYQPDYCPPGGSLVFELRQSSTTGEYVVRAYFTAQTFDQLRNLTPLTLDKPPATVQLLIPDGSKAPANLDVKFRTFQQLLKKAINQDFVEDPFTEVPPGVLTGVPLK